MVDETATEERPAETPIAALATPEPAKPASPIGTYGGQWPTVPPSEATGPWGGGFTLGENEASWGQPKPPASTQKPQPDTSGELALQEWQKEILKKNEQEQARISGEHGAEATGRLANRARDLERQNAAVAHSIDDMPQPWNADREMQERIRGPFENFGSFATIFALTASAFTKQPMINAMYGAASAMTAMRNSDEEGYTRAYNAWKDNTDLAYKRFTMEQTVFNNTDKLFNTDLERWKVQKEADLAKFGHDTALAAMRAGYYPQVFEWQKSQAEAAKGIAEAREKGEEFNAAHNFRKAMTSDERLKSIFPGVSQDKLDYYKLLVTEEAVVKQTPTDKAVWTAQREYMEQNHGEKMPGSQVIDLINRARSSRALGAEAAAVQDAKDKLDRGEITADEYTQQINEILSKRRAGSTIETEPRQIGEAVKKKIEELRKQGVPEDEVQKQAAALRAKLKQESAGITGNQKDWLASQISKGDFFNDTINKAEALLKKHKAITGLGGKISRPAEIVGNWFGSNETDRKQFERYIAELQEWAPRLLNESRGRPLASEVSSISKIVPGLSMGDTTANTARQMKELRDLVSKMREGLRQRWEGGWTPESSPAAPSTTPKVWTPPAGDRPVQ